MVSWQAFGRELENDETDWAPNYSRNGVGCDLVWGHL